MKKYKLYVDSAADVPAELLKRYQIGMLPIPIVFGNESFLTGVDITNEKCYEFLEKADSIPVTSQITPYAFERLYQEEFDCQTQELWLFLINGKGSATVSNALGSMRHFYEECPDAKNEMRIRVFDGANYSGAYGYPAIFAAQQLEMGEPFEAVAQQVQKLIGKMRIYFGLYSLRYAGKSGRIPSAAVFIGETVGIKPIMCSFDHHIRTIGKSRGEKKLIREIAKMAEDDMENGTPYSLMYSCVEQDRLEMEQEMTRRIGYPPLYQFQMSPCIAVNAGPRMIGVIFETSQKQLDKERSTKHDRKIAASENA